MRIFKSLVLPVLLYGSETWTLNSELKRRINSFGTKCLRRIMGYRWYDRVPNQRLLQETDSRHISCIVRERQLRLYGHVVRLPEIDPAHQAVSVEDNPEWRRPRGRPRNSWLRQVDESCDKLFGMCRSDAWVLSREDPRGWSQRVSEATRRCGVCPP